MKKSNLLLILGMGICLVFFQNCLLSPGSQSGQFQNKKTLNTSQSQMTGGDTGYEGKITYGARNPNGQCEDGSEVLSKIEIDEIHESAFLTRDNCEEIDPEKLDFNDLDILPHNLDNLPDNKKVYELYSSKLPLGKIFAFCRGQAADQGSGVVVVDIIVKVLEKNEYQARVVAGKYSVDGELLETRDSGMVSVYRWSTEKTPTNAFFTYRNENGEREWFINVGGGKLEVTGDLVYDKIVRETSWGSIWNYPCYRLIQ